MEEIKPTENGQAILALEDIVALTQGYEVLSGVSCSFRQGRATIIMGTAGAGKSTLIKVAAGLVVPDSGKVMFRGKELSRMTKKELAAFYFSNGFAFQDSALWANQSIGDNLVLPLLALDPRTPRAKALEKAKRFADLLGYKESLGSRPSQLSLGEQKLISIARALIVEPEIVFMDEPTAFLDDAACERVFQLALELKDKGKTLVAVTHSTEFAALVADDLLVMNQGTVTAAGTYNELIGMEDGIVRAVMGRKAREGRREEASNEVQDQVR
jgi:phospholipid/cholesterol/gamma-HCH transport system ATP-binding protein